MSKIKHYKTIITIRKPDIEIVFNDDKTLEANNCNIQYDEHMISVIGKEEGFLIPYGSVKYMRIQKLQK